MSFAITRTKKQVARGCLEKTVKRRSPCAAPRKPRAVFLPGFGAALPSPLQRRGRAAAPGQPAPGVGVPADASGRSPPSQGTLSCPWIAVANAEASWRCCGRCSSRCARLPTRGQARPKPREWPGRVSNRLLPGLAAGLGPTRQSLSCTAGDLTVPSRSLTSVFCPSCLFGGF